VIILLIGKRITKKFGGLIALKDVDFEIKKGEIFGLIGPNGAGKTTFVNLVSGIYRPDSGKILFESKELTKLRPDLICKYGIARTFQLTQTFLDLTVLQNAMMGCVFGNFKKNSMKNSMEIARKNLNFVGLVGKEQKSAKSLTAIELKKLELARSLGIKPKFLMLDEINTGLNPTESNEAINLIKKIRDQGVTILIVEHLMKIIMAICDRIMVLNYGQKIAEGTPKEVASNQTVIKAYLGDSK
jgi:branched-chain amino acid transport system ATP-binding protein